MTENLPELGVGGLVVFLVVRELLKFLRWFLERRESSMDAFRKELHNGIEVLRAEMRTEVAEVQQNLISVTNDVSRMLAQLQVAQDREQRFWDRDWPTMLSSVNALGRRVSYVETGLAEVKIHVGLPSGNTPPYGVRVMSTTDNEDE